MLRFHARAFLRCLTLGVGPLLVRLVSTTFASEDCERFTLFGQSVHGRFALRYP